MYSREERFPDAKLPHPKRDPAEALLLGDDLQLHPDAGGGKALQQAAPHAALEQAHRVVLKAHLQPLLQSDSPKDARGVLDKAQIVQYLEQPVPQVCPSAEVVHQCAPVPLAQGDGHSVDCEVPPAKVLLEGITLDRGQSGRVLVELPARRGNVNLLPIGEGDRPGVVAPVDCAAAARLVPCLDQLLRVAFHRNIDIGVLHAQQNVADRPPHEVGPHPHGLRLRSNPVKQGERLLRKGLLHQVSNALHPEEAGIMRRAAAGELPGAVEGPHQVGAREHPDEASLVHDGHLLKAVGRHHAVRLVDGRLSRDTDDPLCHKITDVGAVQAVQMGLVQVVSGHDADDLAIPAGHGQGFQSIAQHRPVSLVHVGIRRDSDDRAGHDVGDLEHGGNGFVQFFLDLVQECLRVAAVNGGRPRLKVPAAAVGGKEILDVQYVLSTADNDVDLFPPLLTTAMVTWESQ